eukprot:scaffold297699_cov28-Tisochrysis_lutea.AAC.1
MTVTRAAAYRRESPAPLAPHLRPSKGEPCRLTTAMRAIPGHEGVSSSFTCRTLGHNTSTHQSSITDEPL